MPSNTRSDRVANGLGEDMFGVSKRKRNGRACDRCHRNACRCSPGIEGTACSRCEDQQVECTYNRPVKRRGPLARRARPTVDTQTTTTDKQPPIDVQVSATTGSIITTPPIAIVSGPSASSASPRVREEISVHSPPIPTFFSEVEDVISPRAIEDLVEIFYHTIYPIRPYFHWPTFDAQIRQQLYRTDWGLFTVTMAICSLTAGRLISGVSIPNNLHFSQSDAINLSAQCYSAAMKVMPTDITTITDYCQVMKANALLASVCLQNGDLKKLIAHMADYVCLSTIHNFHLEAHWPVDLTEIQRQERRRLFWCVYQQEQYLSSNFGLPIRQNESKSTVLYPAEVYNDNDITATSVHVAVDRVSFLRGWNFCSDIYRLLENIDHIKRVRKQASESEPGSLTDSFLARMSIPKDFVSNSLHLISKMHADLPPQLKTVEDLTGNPQDDRCRFVAFNILLTTQNLKMRLVGTEQPSMQLRCAIASELLDELSAVPLEFFHTLSTGSLHHLAQVGQMLGDGVQHPVSAWRYLQVRNILLLLAEFLEKIESSRISSHILSIKLRGQIARMDQSMKQTSQWSQVSGLLSMGRSLLLGLPDQNSPETANPLNGQKGPTTSQYLNGTQLVIPQGPSPDLSNLWGMGDPTAQIPLQQGPNAALSAVDPTTGPPEQRFDPAFFMPQPPTTQNQVPDLLFSTGQITRYSLIYLMAGRPC